MTLNFSFQYTEVEFIDTDALITPNKTKSLERRLTRLLNKLLFSISFIAD